MYDSTIDVLYNLYDRVEVGGYVVIDDFGGTRRLGPRATPSTFGAARHRGQEHNLHPIDGTGAWFQKARQAPSRSVCARSTLRTWAWPCGA